MSITCEKLISQVRSVQDRCSHRSAVASDPGPLGDTPRVRTLCPLVQSATSAPKEQVLRGKHLLRR